MTHVGILGGGNISETHARAAREIEGVEVVAVHGHNLGKARRLAGLYGGVAYDDLDSFLAHAPMELVLVGSPSGLHAEHGIAADAGGGNPAASSPVVSDVGGHREILSDFLRAVETGAPPLCDGREGRRSVELARAVYESSQTGRAVRLEPKA